MENIRRLRDLMTLSEVEAFFGEPCAESRKIGGLGIGRVARFWKTGDLEVEVFFNRDDQAEQAIYGIVSQSETFEYFDLPRHESALDKFRSWLSRL